MSTMLAASGDWD